MADFLLTAGIDTAKSLSLMKSQLEGILAQLGSSVKNIQMGLNSSGAGLTQEMKGVVSQANQASAAFGKMQASINSVNLGHINTALTGIKGVTAKTKAQIVASVQQADVAVSKVNAVMRTTAQGQERIKTLVIEGTNSMGQAVKQTVVFDQKTQKVLHTLTQISAKYKEIRTGTKGAVSDEEQRAKALAKGLALAEKMSSVQRNWSAASTGKTKGLYNNILTMKAAVDVLNKEFATGKYSIDQYQAKLKELSNSFHQTSGRIVAEGKNYISPIDRMKSLLSHYGSWFIMSELFMEAYRTVKLVVESVRDLDAAMVELKKVTNETDATYAKFFDNAAKRANRLGANLVDTINATADFARLGFSLEEAEQVADAAIVYKNVGDGIEDIGIASESIISTMKAFGVESTNAMSIVDKFNEVGRSCAQQCSNTLKENSYIG